VRSVDRRTSHITRRAGRSRDTGRPGNVQHLTHTAGDGGEVAAGFSRSCKVCIVLANRVRSRDYFSHEGPCTARCGHCIRRP